MKKIITTALLLWGITQGYAQGIQFVKGLNWQQVQEKAKAENKYIFVDCYATWCGPCKQMDAVVYPNSKVGDAMNAKFLSVKLQFDETAADNEETKSWRGTAVALQQQYKLEGFPSFLFFSPEGKLAYRDIGLKSPNDFIAMTKLAVADPMAKFNAQLADYKQGKKDYPGMPELIKMTLEAGEGQLADAMINDFKTNYLDKLSEEELCTPEKLDFIGDHFTLINSKDKFFSLCYNHPDKVDKVKDYKGWANFQVTSAIRREEVDPLLWKDSKAWQGAQPITTHPDWYKMEKAISRKFPKVNARSVVSGSLEVFCNQLIYNKIYKGRELITQNPDWAQIEKDINQDYDPAAAKKLVLAIQIGFYSRQKNWKEFIALRDMQIKEYPPTAMPEASVLQKASTALNMDAWRVFDFCNDKELLTHALAWSELSIKLSNEEEPNEAPVEQLDTKANLLYKLGRVDEAIALETKILDKTTDGGKHKGAQQFQDILDKMKKGEPTWRAQ